MFQRLKMSYVDGSLALGDYMYAVAAHQQIIEYIPEYIDCYDSDSDVCRLNVALELSLFENKEMHSIKGSLIF